jgi:hypothetical protein
MNAGQTWFQLMMSSISSLPVALVHNLRTPCSVLLRHSQGFDAYSTTVKTNTKVHTALYIRDVTVTGTTICLRTQGLSVQRGQQTASARNAFPQSILCTRNPATKSIKCVIPAEMVSPQASRLIPAGCLSFVEDDYLTAQCALYAAGY